MEYRIIIAEDEEIERTALRLILHTHMPQLKIAAETNNGIELLELCKKELPHIVLLDINMPGINGLDAMEQVIQDYPSTYFVIISAYADFVYAQRALKLGAADYLTKPLKTELLISSLNRLMAKMQSSTEDSANLLQMSQKIKVVSQQMEYNIMRAFLSDQITESIRSQFAVLFHTDSEYICILVKSSDPANHKFHSPEVFALLREKLRMFSENFIMQDTGVLHFMILSVDTSKLSSNIHQYLYEFRMFLSAVYKAQGIASAQVYISDAVAVIDDLLDEYKKLSKKCIQYQRKNCDVKKSGFGRLFSLEKVLVDSIMQGDVAVSLQSVENIFLIIKDKSSGDLKMFKEYLRDSLSAIQRGLSLKSINHSYIQMLYENFFFLLQREEDVETVKQAFQNFIISCCEYFHLQVESSAVDIDMKSLQKYIERNYMRDISLDQIAEKYNTSTSYLSKLIKNSFGENYIDYVTNLRIQKAKELLLNTNKTIREISVETGYNSQTYFCKVFKRNVGVNASEYKKWKEKNG